ncbi:MAG: aconitate hydratase, partial [Lentisphaeria bacterium]|nr:aconitate hydratase [Lentisphaeria bacterium]
VAAFSIERIHAANLVNFGILPLQICSPEDYGLLKQGVAVEINELPKQIRQGQEIEMTLSLPEGTTRRIVLRHNLSQDDQELVIRGGKLAQS